MEVTMEEKMKCFAAACRRAGAMGLARCSSGNLSWRIGGDLMFAKPSRVWMSDLRNDQVSVCRISDGAHLSGPKPTVEIRFHSGVLRARSDVNVVFHFQTSFATTLACSKQEANYFVIPEIPIYIGKIAVVPFLAPGSEELALSVIKALTDHDLAMMRNHGQVTVGRDFEHAIQNAVFFELACEILYRAGANAEPLTPEAVAPLLAAHAAHVGNAIAAEA